MSFLKRAQILIGDLWSCFSGQGIGKFTDIDEITAFADYRQVHIINLLIFMRCRIPQVLAYYGVLHYDANLSALLKTGNFDDVVCCFYAGNYPHQLLLEVLHSGDAVPLRFACHLSNQ